jgi:hypothetical protein
VYAQFARVMLSLLVMDERATTYAAQCWVVHSLPHLGLCWRKASMCSPCVPQEISKSNVVDDMVASNALLYGPGEHPDHCVVIKYVPYVGDSKRAMDEYTSEIFM